MIADGRKPRPVFLPASVDDNMHLTVRRHIDGRLQQRDGNTGFRRNGNFVRRPGQRRPGISAGGGDSQSDVSWFRVPIGDAESVFDVAVNRFIGSVLRQLDFLYGNRTVGLRMEVERKTKEQRNEEKTG